MVVVDLVLVPGTVVALLLLTGVVDLLLRILNGRVERVLLPSGLHELNLLGGCSCGRGGSLLCLGLGLAIGRREYAEGDRNSGFKVQGCGLLGSRRT